MTDQPMSNPLVIAPNPITLSSLFQRVWRPTFIILLFVAVAAWTALLGYGVVQLIQMVI
jgi:hypothetical protein